MANVISNDSTATSAAATSPSSASIYCPTSGPGQGPEPHSTPQHHPIDSNRDVDAWDEEELEDDPFFSSEITAMIGSTLVHLIIILSLALVPLHLAQEESAVVIVSEPSSLEDEIPVIDQITFSDTPDNRIGADSVAELEMSQASAENFAEVAEIPNPIDLEPVDMGKIMVNQIFTEPVAPMQRLTNQRGRTGEGTQGAAGAVDRITFELLQTMEENPTLVTWLFDQSGSLLRQRTEIRERFDRIYEELGIIQEQRSDLEQRVDTEVPAKDQPLLTAVMGFGESVEFYTDKPTAKLDEIKAAVDSISVDSSGTERVFTAIETAVDKYKNFRRDRGELGQRRSVVFVVVTDERGDDADRLEEAISACRKWGIPVYVIGVPAPFGREHTLVKYVDPDPKYDQSPQWAQVDQGPESLVPERVQVGFTADFRAERAIDSGFGPYALTRLCYETSGIYFTVHPNRNTNRRVWRNEIDPFSSNLTHFFDPQLMRRYQPDYLAPRDYFSQVKASPLRQALVSAAQLPPVSGISAPKTRFIKRSDAQLVTEFTTAQQAAAQLEPTLFRMVSVLQPGLEARNEEESPRWQAGFDLAMGRALAQKVRTETYNAMLAKGKRGMAFTDSKNNTWVLKASDEISVGSKWQREAEMARKLLKSVVAEHGGTPWALLAQQELAVPIGWQWVDEFTDLTPSPRRQMRNNNNNPPRPARDDQKRMIQRRPTRPVPKL